MTTFKGFNAFGDSAGDSLSAPKTEWKGRGVLPKGKLKRYPGEAANISNGNRRLAKAKHGAGGGSGTSHRGTNAFTKGK
jgi:hypothetical protein